MAVRASLSSGASLLRVLPPSSHTLLWRWPRTPPKSRSEVSPASYVLARPEALSPGLMEPHLRRTGVGWLPPGEQEEETVPPPLVPELEAGGGHLCKVRGSRCRAVGRGSAAAGSASRLLLGKARLGRGASRGIKSVLTHARAQVFSRNFISSAAAAPRSGLVLILSRGQAGSSPRRAASAPKLSSHSPPMSPEGVLPS